MKNAANEKAPSVCVRTCRAAAQAVRKNIRIKTQAFYDGNPLFPIRCFFSFVGDFLCGLCACMEILFWLPFTPVIKIVLGIGSKRV
jgi:hypothetical protein